MQKNCKTPGCKRLHCNSMKCGPEIIPNLKQKRVCKSRVRCFPRDIQGTLWLMCILLRSILFLNRERSVFRCDKNFHFAPNNPFELSHRRNFRDHFSAGAFVFFFLCFVFSNMNVHIPGINWFLISLHYKETRNLKKQIVYLGLTRRPG